VLNVLAFVIMGLQGRDLIVLSAFCVVLGTLVIQGFTLRPLLDRLGFEAVGGVEREISRGRLGIMQAALDTLAGEGSRAAAVVREGYLAAREVAASPEEPQSATEHDRLRLRAIAAQRRTLHRLRAEGAIGDEAFHRLEEEVDWAELDAAPAGSFQPLLTDGGAPVPRTYLVVLVLQHLDHRRTLVRAGGPVVNVPITSSIRPTSPPSRVTPP